MRDKNASIGGKKKQVVTQTRQSRNPSFSMGKNKEKTVSLASELEEYSDICQNINKNFLYKLD